MSPVGSKRLSPTVRNKTRHKPSLKAFQKQSRRTTFLFWQLFARDYLAPSIRHREHLQNTLDTMSRRERAVEHPIRHRISAVREEPHRRSRRHSYKQSIDLDDDFQGAPRDNRTTQRLMKRARERKMPTLNALWNSEKQMTPEDASFSGVLDRDLRDMASLHPNSRRVPDRDHASPRASYRLESYPKANSQHRHPAFVASDRPYAHRYELRETETTPAILPSPSEPDYSFSSSENDELDELDSQGPTTPAQHNNALDAARQVDSYTQLSSPTIARTCSAPNYVSPRWSDYLEDESEHLSPSHDYSDQVSCLYTGESQGSSADASYVKTPEMPTVYIPSPLASAHRAKIRTKLENPRPNTGEEIATKRLSASLMRERRQRLRDGLNTDGGYMKGGMPKDTMDRNFVTRLVPSKLLRLESAGEGWAGELYEEIVQWMIHVRIVIFIPPSH